MKFYCVMPKVGNIEVNADSFAKTLFDSYFCGLITQEKPKKIDVIISYNGAVPITILPQKTKLFEAFCSGKYKVWEDLNCNA